MEIELTEEEKKAIRALKKVAKIWPDSLWLFSGSGSLCVMLKNENGEHAVKSDSGSFMADGLDPEYIVDQINIENDGGDW